VNKFLSYSWKSVKMNQFAQVALAELDAMLAARQKAYKDKMLFASATTLSSSTSWACSSRFRFRSA
jgi:hypothetical protein